MLCVLPDDSAWFRPTSGWWVISHLHWVGSLLQRCFGWRWWLLHGQTRTASTNRPAGDRRYYTVTLRQLIEEPTVEPLQFAYETERKLSDTEQVQRHCIQIRLQSEVKLNFTQNINSSFTSWSCGKWPWLLVIVSDSRIISFSRVNNNTNTSFCVSVTTHQL